MTHSNLSSSTLATTAIGSASTLSSSVALSGRILLSAIFLLSGVSKISASAGMIAYIGSVGLPFPGKGPSSCAVYDADSGRLEIVVLL
jgi:putative oxidoreductase